MRDDFGFYHQTWIGEGGRAREPSFQFRSILRGDRDDDYVKLWPGCLLRLRGSHAAFRAREVE